LVRVRLWQGGTWAEEGDGGKRFASDGDPPYQNSGGAVLSSAGLSFGSEGEFTVRYEWSDPLALAVS
jgi:hypothetical protein